MNPVRFGLVGLGRHGERYAKHLTEDLSEGTLTAVARRDAAEGEAFARRYGVRHHPDSAALCADPAVDAVIVVTPPSSHREIALQAAAAGKHILVEKPMTRTVKGAAAVARAADRAGVTCMVAQTLRYNPVVEAVKGALPSIGPLLVLTASLRLEAASQAWHSDPEVAGGGTLMDLGVHLFDLVRFLTDDEVTAADCSARRVKNRRVEDFFSARLNLDATGAVAHVDAGRIATVRTGRIEGIGEGGEVAADLNTGVLRLRRGEEETEQTLAAGAPAIVRVLRAFVDSIRFGAPVAITPRDGIESLRIVEACARSARDRSVAAMAPFEPEGDVGIRPR